LSTRDSVITHDLKSIETWFGLLWKGERTFDIRADDRGGYLPGQRVRLREYNRQEYTGRYVEAVIDDVYEGFPGVVDGHVVLMLKGLQFCTDALQEVAFGLMFGRRKSA
jgi:hypothetical protein